MPSNLERFKNDLATLIDKGGDLALSMAYECDESMAVAAFQKLAGKLAGDKKLDEKKVKAHLQSLPSFRAKYQVWYSESLALLRQLLPERVTDFVGHYQKPKGRKNIDNESYRIEDFLQGIETTRGPSKIPVATRSSALPHFFQQLSIVEAAKARFESSLFEIRQLVQADVLDSELEASEVLAKNHFYRAAGALAGVVLERHLSQVCSDHKVSLGKAKPTISTFNDALKGAIVIDIPTWRFIQHLGDIRNMCDHSNASDPTEAQVADLIAGVKKISKTVY